MLNQDESESILAFGLGVIIGGCNHSLELPLEVAAYIRTHKLDYRKGRKTLFDKIDSLINEVCQEMPELENYRGWITQGVHQGAIGGIKTPPVILTPQNDVNVVAQHAYRYGMNILNHIFWNSWYVQFAAELSEYPELYERVTGATKNTSLSRERDPKYADNPLNIIASFIGIKIHQRM